MQRLLYDKRMDLKAEEYTTSDIVIYIGKVEAKAEEALKLAKESRQLTTVTEERMKSIQHRLDGQEKRLDILLADNRELTKRITDLQGSIDANTKLTKGISSGMKALVSLLSFFTALMSIARLIFL